MDPRSFRPDYPLVVLVGWDETKNRYIVAWIALNPFAYTDRRPLSVDFYEGLGLLCEMTADEIKSVRDPAVDPRILGWLVGMLKLDKAAGTPGGAVAGQVEAAIY
jgi:hypothetical protein